VDKKRAATVPHTNAEDPIPERTPNALLLRPSGTLSAYIIFIKQINLSWLNLIVMYILFI